MPFGFIPDLVFGFVGIPTLGGDIEYEYFTGSREIVLYKAGSFTPYDTYELNNDGSIQTPFGEIKKRGY